jgi:hypothetical protein
MLLWQPSSAPASRNSRLPARIQGTVIGDRSGCLPLTANHHLLRISAGLHLSCRRAGRGPASESESVASTPLQKNEPVCARDQPPIGSASASLNSDISISVLPSRGLHAFRRHPVARRSLRNPPVRRRPSTTTGHQPVADDRVERDRQTQLSHLRVHKAIENSNRGQPPLRALLNLPGRQSVSLVGASAVRYSAAAVTRTRHGRDHHIRSS